MIIDIADVYNRPLPLIHTLLLRYWKGDEFESVVPVSEADD